MRVEARLRHEPSNRFNRNAIIVCAPPSFASKPARRRIGYVSEYFLDKVGHDTLPTLIEFAGGEVTVHVQWQRNGAIAMVCLPDPERLGTAVAAFLEPRGLKVSGGPSWKQPARPQMRRHEKPSKKVDDTLKLLAAPWPAHDAVRDVNIATEGALSDDEPNLLLMDADSERRIGYLNGDLLVLSDERDREAVLGALAAKKIPVLAPVQGPGTICGDSWPTSAVPRAFLWQKRQSFDFRAHDPSHPNHTETFAIYARQENVLWVEDSRLVAPALNLAHRMGLDPQVGVPRRSWNLYNEIPTRSLHGVSPRRAPDRWILPIFKSAGDLVPSLLDGIVEWTTPSSSSPRPSSSLPLYEYFVQARSRLFPHHTLDAKPADCRLCGRLAASFTTEISFDRLAYCRGCLHAADTGLNPVRAKALRALRELSGLEYDGEPMLASQIDTLHVDPAQPLAAAEIDRRLLYRFALPRTRFSWSRLLQDAGLLQQGLRGARGTTIGARDGHLCLSMQEKLVCDFMHQHHVKHDREPLYPKDTEHNASGRRRADWRLEDGTLIELWGLPKDPVYAAKMVAKRELARRHKLRLVEIYPSDLDRLPEIFRPWVRPSSSKWTWSPPSSSDTGP